MKKKIEEYRTSGHDIGIKGEKRGVAQKLHPCQCHFFLPPPSSYTYNEG